MGRSAATAAASSWARRALPDLLAAHGLAGVAEEAFPNDGWSGATLTALDGPDGRYILKRTSWAADWIARSTRDHALREAVLAAEPVALPHPLAPAHLGAAAEGTSAAILMPDLSAWLIPWDRPDGKATIVHDETLERVLVATAAIHAFDWAALSGRSSGAGVGAGADAGADAGSGTGDRDGAAAGDAADPAWPWCPVRERLELTSRAAALRYRAGGLPVGERFLAGWDAFEELAPPAAATLVGELGADTRPLLAALAGLPPTGLHGDLKLANVALLPDGRTACIDWQMTAWAPVAVEMGWFLVANVAQLAASPDDVLERYRAALVRVGGTGVIGDWPAQRDLAILVGLLLRGWRKGLDAAAGGSLPTGASAGEDLRWWAEEAVDAASRRL